MRIEDSVRGTHTIQVQSSARTTPLADGWARVKITLSAAGPGTLGELACEFPNWEMARMLARALEDVARRSSTGIVPASAVPPAPERGQ
jgi:hypothetical protein